MHSPNSRFYFEMNLTYISNAQEVTPPGQQAHLSPPGHNLQESPKQAPPPRGQSPPTTNSQQSTLRTQLPSPGRGLIQAVGLGGRVNRPSVFPMMLYHCFEFSSQTPSSMVASGKDIFPLPCHFPLKNSPSYTFPLARYCFP